KRFAMIGAGLIIVGLLLHFIGINPIVKKIWTPAWTIFSGGCCFLLLAIFYGIIDIANYRKWAFLFMVIGMNSIAAYVIAESLAPFIGNTLYVHLGHNYDQIFGDAYSTLVKGSLVLFIEWMMLYWMYKRKIFIKI